MPELTGVNIHFSANDLGDLVNRVTWLSAHPDKQPEEIRAQWPSLVQAMHTLARIAHRHPELLTESSTDTRV